MEEALENLEIVVNSINETKRAAENINKIMSIQKSLDSKTTFELLQPGRFFIKEGHFQEVRNTEYHYIYLCLFNDMLLLAEKKKNKFGTMRRLAEKYLVTDNAPLYSVAIKVNVDGLLFQPF